MFDVLPASREGLLTLLVAIVLMIVWGVGLRRLLRLLRRPQSPAQPAAAEPRLEELAPSGPPTQGPHLTLHHIPVRLVVLVVAPVGRGSQVPSAADVPRIVDQVVPGLNSVAQAHGARVRLWPPQLSTQGFASAFFADMPLPGNRGKGTPWSALAGRVSTAERSFLVGLVVRAAIANNLGQLTITDETRWLDALRVSQ